MPNRLIVLTCVVYMLAFGCRDRYVSDYTTPETGYLVVEGFINNSDSPTIIKLSRTARLMGEAGHKPETGATIFVESNNNNRYPLHETIAGSYSTGSGLQLDPLQQYRLSITTNNKEYLSDFTSVKNTPDIDSITWKKENDGLQLYVHSQDPTGNIEFFQWKYDETWEVHTPFESFLEYVYDSAGKIKEVWFRPPGQLNTTVCWRYSNSRNLILAATDKLNASVVQSPINFIPPASDKLSVRYSILVKQYGISKKAYNFLLTMKKNTEGIGSIFDPQPSEISGNITCINNPDELVIGFVEVSEEKTKRIFLTSSSVGGWISSGTPCLTKTIDNIPDSIEKNGIGWVPLLPQDFIPDPPPMTIITFLAALPACVDCRISGGSLEKPPYWP